VGFAPKLSKKRYFGCINWTLGAEMTNGTKPEQWKLWVVYNNTKHNGHCIYTSDSESKIQCNNFIDNQVHTCYIIDMQLLDL
jgi:hypothetical protein